MSKHWENYIVRNNSDNTAEELTTAALRLATEQVIYYSDMRNRGVYWAIAGNEHEMRRVLDPLGLDLTIDPNLRFACAVPRFAKTGPATVNQSMLALVLRMIYDSYAQLGQMNDYGEVECDIVELEEKYRLLTGRELPSRGELTTLLHTLNRWGIARRHTDDDEVPVKDIDFGSQPYIITIRPAITVLLGEATLQRLVLWKTQGAGVSIRDETPENTNPTEEKIA
jgi:hypothetical protein